MIHVRMNYEMLIGLLQGKEIHVVHQDGEVTIIPPFDGVFLSHEQVREIEHSAEYRVIKLLSDIQKSNIVEEG